jgi:hypothetical protein
MMFESMIESVLMYGAQRSGVGKNKRIQRECKKNI